MSMKRFIVAVALAAIVAIVPVSPDADAALGLGLSDAACAEGSCGGVSTMDCICPDLQIPNRWPRCDDPPGP